MTDGIEVEAAMGEGVRLPLDLGRVEEVVRHVLAAEEVRAAEISIAFVADPAIATLNEGYLAHQGTTDVISFALHGEGERPLGDIYVGADQAARQSAEVGVPVEEELLRLAIHGTLHVLGYDHPAEAERSGSPMYRRQEELLASFLDRVRADER
ncbi:MAG TPA: rRNA maturation RNase YbeY [Longimicrobiaceae bacterium]